MRVLGIDTSSSVGSVALIVAESDPRAAQLVAESTARVSNAHGESLLPLVDSVLRAAHCTLEGVELIAVGIGPGSFTGTRVGVATAKGLALGADRPLRGVSAFEALALDAGAAVGSEVAVAIDARKGEVYLAVVVVEADDVRPLGEPIHAPPQEAWGRLGRRSSPVAAAGDGVAMVPELSGLGRDRIGSQAPRAAAVAALAGARQLRVPLLDPRDPAGADALEPLYVRPPDITLQKPRESRK